MTTMRISGLASGMDIDTMVEKLMAAERLPMDKLEQQKQTYEWQRDAYREVNSKLKAFDTYIADNFILKSLNTKTATSSNADLVSVKATNAATGTLSIDSVTKLATAARGISNVQLSADGKIVDGSETLKNLGITDKSISLKSIQANGELATKETKIEFDPDTTTISELVSKINSSDAGVSAIFENGRLSITAKNTGAVKNTEDNTLDVAEVQVTAGADVFGQLGFSSLVGKTTGDLANGGSNASFEVNGIATERSTNNFTINGYNVTLNKKFNEGASSTTVAPVTMTATTNVDEMMDRIKDFVKTYNGLIKDLNGKRNEQVYRDFKPLTALQKKEMEESEIKLWEEKAKSGMLRGDSIIQSGLSSIRGLVYQTNPDIANSKYNTLYKIGITTSTDWNTGGTLEINDTTLRKALEEDPDAVIQLLTGSGEGASQGFMRKVRTEMDVMEKKIDERAGRGSMVDTQYTLGKYLKNVNQRLDDWEKRLQSIENRYWKQFGAMESMINKANSQSTSLMSQFYS